MKKEIHLIWTHTRETDRHTLRDLINHQLKPGKENLQHPAGRTGGLGLEEQLFTRMVLRDGRLFTIRPEFDQIYISIQGGLSDDYHYKNTMTIAQMNTLTNEIRSLCHSFPEHLIMSDKFIKFDTSLWLKSVLI
jgi:hypothetical protein